MTKTTKSIALLVIGACFLYFSNGRYSYALAAWLYPVFILQISRKEKAIYSNLFIPLVTGICSQLSFWKFTYNDPSNALFYLPFILGLLMGYLFYIDRLLYSRFKGITATLAFPLLYTSFDFLLNLFNPFGTLGILGYSQIGFLPFAQLASVTGMWGLSFMITWFGSLSYWVLQNYADKKIVTKTVSIYFSIFISILVYGSIRLVLPLDGGTVKTAGIHTHDKNVEGNEMHSYLDKNDTVSFKKLSDTIIRRLIQETVKEARAGAKIVLWSEVSPKILKTNEDSFVNVFKRLAMEQQIYLVTTPFSVVPPGKKSENKILLFAPDGSLILTHYKYGGNFMEGTIAGNKIIKTVATAYGKLSAIICWDGDFPSIVKQVGKQGTDILFVPASDWEEIDSIHSTVAVFRGIENGCSVVRQTRNGLSIMTDPRGKVIAEMDHFKNSTWVTIGQVPTKKWFTLYPIIGDLFGWLSFIGLLYFILRAFTNKKLSKTDNSEP